MSFYVAREIVVPQSEKPKTLENFLKKRFPIGYVRKLFRRRAVKVNGKRSGPKEIAHPGDRIELFVSFEERKKESSGPSPPRFEVIYEDRNLLVLGKPAGIAVHGGKGIPQEHSLLGMLQAAYGPRGVSLRPVHRLDRHTSGLLLVAKKDEVAKELEGLFKGGKVEKEYLALVKGRLYPRKGKIDMPLPGRDGRLRRAVTLYRVERELAETTLIRVRTETGRMHQIRLHLAGAGHPVVMDKEHGDFEFNKRFSKAYGLKRQFLHAETLSLQFRGHRFTWSAPLPEDLRQTLAALEGSTTDDGRPATDG